MKKITFSLVLVAFAAVAQNTQPADFAQVSLRKITLSASKQVPEVLAALYPMAGNYNDYWASRTEIFFTTFEGTCNHSGVTADGTSGIFTAAQKNILDNSDVGTVLHLKISYKEKELFSNEAGEVKQMHLAISVMPDVEAAYPGGLGSAIDYLRSSVLKNAPETDTSMISRRLTSAVIKFTLDENGKVIEARMDRSSSDEMLDKRLLEATFNMPAWTPAMNVHGEKMKRELSLSVDKRRVAGC